MAQARTSRFDTRDTSPEQKQGTDFVRAVVARDTRTFLRGHCPQEIETFRNIGRQYLQRCTVVLNWSDAAMPGRYGEAP